MEDLNQTTPTTAPTNAPTSTPTPTAPVAAPVAPTPSAGTQNTKLVAAIVVAVLVLVSAICAAVLLNGKKDDKGADGGDQTTSESGEATGEEPVAGGDATETSVKTIVAQIKDEVAATSNAKIMDFDSETGYIFEYRAKDMRVAAAIEKVFGFSLHLETAKDEEGAQLVATIENKLTESGLKYSSNVDAYERDGVLCRVKNDRSSYNVILSCTHASWLDEETIALTNELANAIAASGDILPDVIQASPDDIEDSEYKPYQRLKAEFSEDGYGYYELFYRTSPEGEWHDALGGNGIPECSEFLTEDARKAFSGYGCYDDNNEMSTVQP